MMHRVIHVAALAVGLRCCKGYHVDGVRPDGRTWCVAKPACPDDSECGSAFPDPPRYPVEIHCTGGSVPIVVDERTVGCQMRH
jgi:hypothetical protein